MLENTIRQYVVFHHIECFLQRANFLCRNCSLYLLLTDVTQIYGSRPCKTKGCFVVIVVVEMAVLGRTVETS